MTRQPREVKEMYRFAMEQSSNTRDTVVDPQKIEWLNNAVKNLSVDLVSVMKSDISQLSAMLAGSELDEECAKLIMDELLSITEEIYVANDFFKVGGKELLTKLIFNGPVILKDCSYELLANLTQNNPNAQQICLSNNFLQHLLSSLSKEDKLWSIKKNLLSISCLVRHYDPGVTAFCEADGFSVVLKRLLRLTENSADSSEDLLDSVVLKGAFLILNLVQELQPKDLATLEIHHLPDKLADLIMQSPLGAQEHLARALFILLSGVSTGECDNQPSGRSPLALSLPVTEKLRLWLADHYQELKRQDDAAHLELCQDIQALTSLLENATH